MGGKQGKLSQATIDFVNAAIKADDIAVFSKTYCPYCTSTKDTLSKLSDVSIKIYELDEMENGADVQSALQTLTGQRTVPNVFAGGKHVGGNDDTQSAFRSGKLQEMLGK